MRIYIKNRHPRTDDYELAATIALGLIKAGYKVNIGKERIKEGKQLKNVVVVDYEEVTEIVKEELS